MPKVVDHEARRAQVMDSCFRLMAEEGYGAATMRRIAKAAGVSTGTLYHYFPDKLSILDAMFDRLIARDAQRVNASLDQRATVDVRIQLLYRFIREETAYLRDLLRLALEVHRHEPGEDARGRVQDAVARYRQAMAEVLAIEGPIVSMAFSFLIGGITHGLLDPEAVDLEAEEQLTRAVWAQIEAGLTPL